MRLRWWRVAGALALVGVLGLGLIVGRQFYRQWQVERQSAATVARIVATHPAWRAVPDPLQSLTVLVCKDPGEVHLYADGRPWGRWPMTADSGGPGPKLRRGDGQIPEGFYRITSFNPKSRYHLSIRLDYPSAADRRQAVNEGREDLGGDIFIHGGTASIGCIAIGDPAIELVYAACWLACQRGVEPEVVIMPVDLRHRRPPMDERPWVRERYARMSERVLDLE